MIENKGANAVEGTSQARSLVGRVRRAAMIQQKYMHALGALICALVLAFGVFVATGCSSVLSPESDNDAVHLIIKVPDTKHTAASDGTITSIDQVIQRMVDAYAEDHPEKNVTIEVQTFEQDGYESNIVECYGTDEAADILYADYFNMTTFIHDGRVVPLDDIITDEIRDDIYDYIWDESTFDGRVYAMPYLTRQNVLAYNKDLFYQAGLEDFVSINEIQSWSHEEWDYVLDTLAQNLPEGTYPMMMYAKSDQGDTHIMALLGSRGSTLYDESGHMILSEPEGVAGLEEICQGVDRGWFPPHAQNLDINDCSSLFKQGQLAIYFLNNVSYARYGSSVGLVNFPGTDGGIATTFTSGFEVFDNDDPNRVAAAKDFLSYVYSNQDLLAYAAGALPASQSVAQEYRYEIQGFDLFEDNYTNVINIFGDNPDVRGVREHFHVVIADLLAGRITAEEAAQTLDETCNAVIDEGYATSQLHK